MTRNYLLPCSCGRSVPIEVGQAGQSISCECGAALDVPTMRQIRELEQAPTDDSLPQEQTSTWSPRKGVILLGLVIAVASGGVGIYLWATRPQLFTYDLEASLKAIDEEIDALSPAATWVLWKMGALKQGLVEYTMPAQDHLAAQIAMHQRFVVVAFSVAGIGLVISIVALAWKPGRRPKTG